jgi:GNAT superfamily N-acetyltransferase
LKCEMTSERLKVTCRPARAEDTPDMLELTRTIWEGGDYVPQVWQDWLADPQGILAVAEYAGHVLGLGKLTRLAAGQWWLEGLRTHPEYEGHGIATSLHAYLVDTWLRDGDGTLRLATASFRKAVQHLCERSGFAKAAEFSPFRAPAQPGSARVFQPIQADQAASALASLRASPTLTLCSGLIDLGWEWCTPTIDHLMERARWGEAFWWREQRGIIIIRHDEDDENEGSLLSVQTLACQIEDLPALLYDSHFLAMQFGYPTIEWRAPLQGTALTALEKAGFERGWDASVYIYTREHPNQV